MKWKKKIEELCAIDVRSLAIFRIGIALTLLWDLYDRSHDLVAHYTDLGAVPRDLLIGKYLEPWNFSFHLINGTWPFQLFLFTLAAFFAITLLIGYKTRISTIVSWLLLISLQNRNPIILQGGDIVLRLLLFWSIFLPLGACLAIDKPKNKISNTVVSVATLCLLLQVCFIYWFTALLKTDSSWRQNGDAIWYAFHIETLTRPLGTYLLQFPNLLKALTFGTFYLELIGPFFAFMPFWTAPLRFVTAITFILFHLVGLNLTMVLAHFPYICAIAWLVFIPGWFWNKIWKKEENGISYKENKISQGIALFFIVYILLWNIRTLEIPTLPEKLNVIGQITRTDQYWNMFSPFPLREDGWYVIPAELRDGTIIDLNTGKLVSYDKPLSIADSYGSDRWRSFMMNLFFQENMEEQFLYFGKYLTSTWNHFHKDNQQAVRFDIEYMLRVNGPLGSSSPIKTLLWHHECFK